MTPPEPFTSMDCDLRGMEWMPLFGARLFMSDFEARATDEEFRAAVRLWWMAWQQVPAASLPSDDAVLCRLAGLGRDLRGWMKIREAALYGFTLCSDGRFYHKLLAGQAKDAWEKRVKERDRKAAYRARKDSGGTGTGGGQNEDVPRDKSRTTNGTEQHHVAPPKEGISPVENQPPVENPDELLSINGKITKKQCGFELIYDSGTHCGPLKENDFDADVPRDKYCDVRVDKTRQDKTIRKKERKGGSRASAPPRPPPRKAEIPEDWLPDREMIAYAKERGITDIVESVEQFVNYNTAHGKTMSDWCAGWRLWCNREPEFRRNGK